MKGLKIWLVNTVLGRVVVGALYGALGAATDAGLLGGRLGEGLVSLLQLVLFGSS